MKTTILSISMIALMAVSGFSAGTDKDCCKKKNAKCEVKCEDHKKCASAKDSKTAEECMAACKKAEGESKTESSAKKSCCKK